MPNSSSDKESIGMWTIRQSFWSAGSDEADNNLPAAAHILRPAPGFICHAIPCPCLMHAAHWGSAKYPSDTGARALHSQAQILSISLSFRFRAMSQNNKQTEYNNNNCNYNKVSNNNNNNNNSRSNKCILHNENSSICCINYYKLLPVSHLSNFLENAIQ